MKKKVLYIIIVLITSFSFKINKVEATKLTHEHVTYECIYSDGGLYTSKYNVGLGKQVHNRLSYNLSGSNNDDANKGSGSVFVNDMPQYFYGSTIGEGFYLHCLDSVNFTNYENQNFYKFYNPFNASEDKNDFGASKSTWCKIWYCTSAEEKEATEAAEAAQEYSLVSERLILNANAPEPNLTLYYVQEADQAAGLNSYISIHIYDNVVLLEKGDRVTKLDQKQLISDPNLIGPPSLVEAERNFFLGLKWSEKKDEKGNVISGTVIGDVPKNIYINSPEPIPKTNSSGAVSNKFKSNQIRYSVTLDSHSTNTNHYVYADEIPQTGKDKDTGALCTKILPKTSQTLRKVIKYMQILIPVFLVVLIALDVSRIVLAGNVEEELPKRRKAIITRLIVAVTFFFLPLLIQLIIKTLIASGANSDIGGFTNVIEYIGCLFE